MNYNKLSADPTALILGIVSLFIVLLGCCCGFLAIISLILSIVGLVLANKSLNEFNSNPENFDYQSKKNVYVGKVLCIIGASLSTLFLIIAIVLITFYQVNISNVLKDKMNEIKEIKKQTSDSLYIKKNSDEIFQEIDTAYTDSITIEEIKK